MSFRPTTFDEIIGQESIKKCLKIAIKSAKVRNDVFGHSLWTGNSGKGKTTLALVTAHELGSDILIANGGSINKLKDILPYLTRMKRGSVLFIDEIHRINTNVQESLYTVLEDFRLDICKGAKSIEFEKFTVIGATTEVGLLLEPLRNRFIHHFQLQEYSIRELSSIIIQTAKKMPVEIDDDAVINIARRSRFTPRIANSLLMWCRDYVKSFDRNKIGNNDVQEAMKLKKIDKNGLDIADRQYIMVLRKANKPLGLNTISCMTGIPKETIESKIEPFLFKLNLLEKTTKGRKLLNVK